RSRHVRRQQDAGLAPERRRRWQRLLLEHVQRGASQIASLQRVNNCPLPDHAASRNIHQHRTRRQLCQEYIVYQAFGVRGQWQADNEVLRMWQHIGQLLDSHRRGHARRVTGRTLHSDDVHPERPGAPCNRAADMPHSDDSDGSTIQLIEPHAIPHPLSRLLHELVERLGKVQHGPDGELTHRRAMHAAALGQQNAILGERHVPDFLHAGRQEVDPVVSCQSGQGLRQPRQRRRDDRIEAPPLRYILGASAGRHPGTRQLAPDGFYYSGLLQRENFRLLQEQNRFDPIGLHVSSIARRRIWLTLCTSYFSSTMPRLASAKRATIPGRSASRSMASANGSTVLGSTRYPFTPSTVVSLQPGASVVMMARPVAMASSTERGVPSRYEGNTSTEHH